MGSVVTRPTLSVYEADRIYQALFKVREKLTPVGTWTQNHFARDAQGSDCEPRSLLAVSWCMWGALRATASTVIQRITLDYLGDRTIHYSKKFATVGLASFNDNLCRTQTDALLFLDWCIAYREWELETGEAQPV